MLEKFLELGYAKIANNELDLEIIQDFYIRWEQFFQSEDKFKYKGDIDWPIGYIGKKYYQDYLMPYEDFYYHPSAELCPHWLMSATELVYQSVLKTANIALSDTITGIKNKLNITDGLDNIYGTVMRILYYPKLQIEEKYYSTKTDQLILNTPHKDHNFLTLLLPATHSGLEIVLNNNNTETFDAQEGEISIMAGEQLEKITNGKIAAPLHRVICDKKRLLTQSRLAVAFFIKICPL